MSVVPLSTRPHGATSQKTAMFMLLQSVTQLLSRLVHAAPSTMSPPCVSDKDARGGVAIDTTFNGGTKIKFAAATVPRQRPLVLPITVGSVKVRRLEAEKERS
jgi:hypothetical protein